MATLFLKGLLEGSGCLIRIVKEGLPDDDYVFTVGENESDIELDVPLDSEILLRSRKYGTIPFEMNLGVMGKEQSVTPIYIEDRYCE